MKCACFKSERSAHSLSPDKDRVLELVVIIFLLFSLKKGLICFLIEENPKFSSVSPKKSSAVAGMLCIHYSPLMIMERLTMHV